MADQKVSQLSELAAGDLDPAADWLLVSDMSVGASKKMKAAEMIRASLPYISTFWDFTTGSLLPTVSFTRASGATRRNASAAIETVSTDVPAWHYSTAGFHRGLRIFGARTNLVKQGTTIVGTSAIFGAVRSTITASAATSPDGTSNAARIVEDSTAGSTHYASTNGISVTSGLVYTLSCYAKAGTRTWLHLRVYNPLLASNAGASFNLSTGIVGTINAGIASAGIEDAGNGWYRCWIVFTAANTTATGPAGLHMASADNAPTYNGNGASDIYLWGVQFEQSDGPTSFIPTTTATAARAADTALITNANALADQAWIIKARAAMYAPIGSNFQTLFQVDDGTANNRRTVYRNSSRKILVDSVVGGVTQASLDVGAVADDTDFAVSCRFADNNFAASLNGGAIVTDVGGANPLGMTSMRVGAYSTTGYEWSSTIRTIETRRTASDTELPLLAA